MLRRTASEHAPFPFDRLDGRPLIYATLGTVLTDSEGALPRLAAACSDLDVQLAIALGGTGRPFDYAALPGNPIVVGNAPQLAVLKVAAVTFCHGGLNTVLESLAAGVPALAMPHSTDQFGVAQRLIRSGAGEAIASRLSRQQLHGSLNRLLRESRYRERAQLMRESIDKAAGQRRAADLIEQALATQQ